jgi:hypothetical protein
LNFGKAVDNLAKRFERISPGTNNREDGIGYWKDKMIIPLEDWTLLKGTSEALEYFPDDFQITTTFVPESEIKHKDEETRKWYSDYLELMPYTKNENYGRAKCFDCLLEPGGDDPIFIGINKLMSKGLGIEYPCKVVNIFRCPFERSTSKKDSGFDVNDLFGLREIGFAAEISLAKARKDDSEIRIKSKEELFHALTDIETLDKILEQGAEAEEVDEDIKRYLRENRATILDYFMRIKDFVTAEELRFY